MEFAANFLAPSVGSVREKREILVGFSRLLNLVFSTFNARLSNCISSPSKGFGGVRHPEGISLAGVAFLLVSF